MKGFLRSLAVLVLSLLCLGCTKSEGQDTSEGDAASGTTVSRERRVAVQTETIVPGVFRDEFEITTLLEPREEISLATEFGGFVREVNFDKGQRVRKGQVLARIGDDLAQARLDQAKADLLAAEANFIKVDRLVERQALPQQDLVAATSRRDNAAAIVREMEIRLERAIVRAPMSGVAVDRALEPGEVVSPGQRLTTLHSVDRLKAASQVPDTEVGWLSKGREALVMVDAFPGRIFSASLDYVAPTADPDTRTFLVEFALGNEGGSLKPGMVGRLHVVRRVVEDALVVPTDSLVVSQEGFVAFVVRECSAELREVVVGATEGDRALVESGLSAGEELVTAGQSDLVQGQAVRSESCR